LLENLRRLAAQLLEMRADRDCAVQWARQQLAQPASASSLVTPPSRLSDACVAGLLQALRDQGSAGPAVEWLEDWLPRPGLAPPPGPVRRRGAPPRAHAPGRQPGVDRQLRPLAAPAGRPRLEPLLRGGQPGREPAARRPGRRLSPAGLRHPRSLPPRRRAA